MLCLFLLVQACVASYQTVLVARRAAKVCEVVIDLFATVAPTAQLKPIASALRAEDFQSDFLFKYER